MNCCDYYCNQGPNCTARRPTPLAGVNTHLWSKPESSPSWLSYVWYLTGALLLAGAVMLVSGVTVMLLDHQKKPKLSPCVELIEQHRSTGVPAHIQIKCKDYL